MQFKLLALATILGLSQARRDVLGLKVLIAVQNITIISGDLYDRTRGANTTAAAEQLIVGGLGNINSQVQRGLTALDLGANSPCHAKKVDADEQQDICRAFDIFTKVQSGLLGVIIDEPDILSNKAVTSIIGSALSTLQGGYRTFVSGVVEIVPDCADSIQADVLSLHKLVQQAVDTYTA
ncbi:hypothetical protein BX600DRAFT_516962 [Xylariales sp. PMI_506]|nr:hypothetical protein BX600DRAFT_516962 [Xylariales sp. PMI_506]